MRIAIGYLTAAWDWSWKETHWGLSAGEPRYWPPRGLIRGGAEHECLVSSCQSYNSIFTCARPPWDSSGTPGCACTTV